MGRDFRKVKAWQLADDFAVAVYAATKSFPRDELYGLTSQVRRAVVSVAANIAEGAAREHKRQYLNFLYTARGSLAEVQYLLHFANRIGYLACQVYDSLDASCVELARTLAGLIGAVAKECD